MRCAVEQHRLLMVQARVTAVFDLDAGHVEAVHVPGMPEPRRIAVLHRFGDEPHRNAAVDRCDDGVGMPPIGDAVHDGVDPLRLGEVALDGSVGIRLGRSEIQLGVLREHAVFARQGPDDVGEVAVLGGVDPEIVVLGAEAVDDRRLVGEEDRFIDVVAVDRHRQRQPGIRAVVRAAELHDALAGEQHHLPVEDAAREALPHRNPGILQERQDRAVLRVGGVGARVHDDPHRARPHSIWR